MPDANKARHAVMDGLNIAAENAREGLVNARASQPLRRRPQEREGNDVCRSLGAWADALPQRAADFSVPQRMQGDHHSAEKIVARRREPRPQAGQPADPSPVIALRHLRTCKGANEPMPGLR